MRRNLTQLLSLLLIPASAWGLAHTEPKVSVAVLREECERLNQNSEWLADCEQLGVILAQLNDPRGYTPQDPATCERRGYPCPETPYLGAPPGITPPLRPWQPPGGSPQIDPPQDPRGGRERRHPLLETLPFIRRLER